jgi:hypothetical protein
VRWLASAACSSCDLASPEKTQTLLREADELVAILTTIVRRARLNNGA